MKDTVNSFEQSMLSEAPQGTTGGTAGINFRRILGHALHYWYLVVLSVLIALSIAFIVNRYATRIYTVSASIIVREGTENAAAEFLYKSNPLVNPYRNFFNELYIMRSYPLLQEVVESLNYGVAWYREGNIKTVEIYEKNFPFQIHVLPGEDMPWGRTMAFEATGENTFNLEYLSDDGEARGDSFKNLAFNDTVAVNGYHFYVETSNLKGSSYLNKPLVVQFRDPYALARSYSTRLNAKWAQQGASVIDLDITGPVPEKETDFLRRFIERYQQYDVDKKNIVATKSIEFLDRQLATIGDSLSYFDGKIEDFKQSHFLSSFEGEAGRILQQIEQLETQRSQFTLYENYFTYLETYISTSKDYDQIVSPSAVGISDPVLTGLIGQLTEVQFSLRMLGDLQTEVNPLVVERRKKNSAAEGRHPGRGKIGKGYAENQQ